MITGAYWSPSDKHTGYFALMQPPMPDPHTPSIRCLLLPRPYRMIRCFYRHLMPANLSCKVNSDHGPDDNSLSGYRCRDLVCNNSFTAIPPPSLRSILFYVRPLSRFSSSCRPPPMITPIPSSVAWSVLFLFPWLVVLAFPTNLPPIAQ